LKKINFCWSSYVFFYRNEEGNGTGVKRAARKKRGSQEVAAKKKVCLTHSFLICGFFCGAEGEVQGRD